MIIKTSELEGAALDWAVAGLVHNEKWRHGKYEGGLRASMHGYHPSTDWFQGGVLIERYQIDLQWIGLNGKAVAWNAHHQDVAQFQCAETPLVAAMRAIVTAELGETVDVPEELIK